MVFTSVLTQLADQIGSVPADTTKTVIIATAGVVISAALGAFAIIWQKRMPVVINDDNDDKDESKLVTELRTRIAELRDSVRKRDKRIETLENNFWERGINPHTFQPVRAEDRKNENTQNS